MAGRRGARPDDPLHRFSFVLAFDAMLRAIHPFGKGGGVEVTGGHRRIKGTLRGGRVGFVGRSGCEDLEP